MVERVAEGLDNFLIAAIGPYFLLGHGRSGTRLVKSEEIRLMPVAGFAAMKSRSVEGRAVQAIRLGSIGLTALAGMRKAGINKSPWS